MEQLNIQINEVDIAKLEKLNEDFRDALITFREYRYHGAGIEQSKVTAIQLVMKRCIEEANILLNKNKIKDKKILKEVSHKYFMVEFLNELFGDDVYYIEEDIDCG